MYILYIIIFIIIALLFLTKIKVKVLNIGKETDVLIQYGLIRIHINYETFMKRIAPVRVNNFNLGETLKMTKTYFDLYPSLKSILKRTVVEQLYVVRFVSKDYKVGNTIYLNTTYFSAMNFLITYLEENSKKIKHRQILINQESLRNDFDFNIKVSIYFLEIVIAAVAHLGNLISVFRKQKEAV